MKKSLLLITLLATLFSPRLLAADFPFGTVLQTELEQKNYPADSNAHGVVLNEFGKSFITERSDHIALYHEYHVKIKIFDSKAFKEGNIEIPIGKGDNDTGDEEIINIQGVTYYLDDNGSLHKADLDPKKVFTVKENKYYNTVKFAMPGLRNGCIIEYSYTLISPFIFNYRKWDFQSDIPKMHSEYNASIPAIYNYNVVLRGRLKLTKTASTLERECFTSGGIKCDCSNINWSMDNVPAFEEEDYMTAAKNFLSAIYFELSDYTSLRNGLKVKVAKEWPDIDYTLKTNNYFGSEIKRTGLMKARIKDIIAGKTDELSKAKAVYTFIQKNIKWNGFYSKYSDDGIRKALDDHSGSIGDINLALIAALSAAGLNTEAVLISTREHGSVNKLYPTESDFNYVIAKVNIGDKKYLLDASDKLLGFGMLPLRCINDQGRVLSMSHPSYWMDVTEPQKKSAITTLDLTLQTDGKFKGAFTRYSYGYEGYEKRNQIKKFNSTEEYVDNLDEASHNFKITKSAIDNLDSLEAPLIEHYDIEINTHFTGESITLNPRLFGRVTLSPFKLADRTYPVDMGMPSDTRYLLTLHLPDGYQVESAPKDIAITMPNNGGSIISGFANNEGAGYNFSQLVKFNKPVYATEEYPYLKEMYNRLILSQKTEIVFKKTTK